MRVALGVAVAAFAGACLRSPSYQCQTSAQCEQGGAAGRCEPSGFCSVPDPACGGGYRWGDGSPDAGTCVGVITGAVNVCLVQAKRSPADDTCVATVCAAMPRCCTREWSDQCVQQAETTCDHPCGNAVAEIGQGLIRVQHWDGAKFATVWSKTTFANTGYSAVAWGDVNADLKPDLATCESKGATGEGKVCVWTNGGSCGEMFCQEKCIDISDCEHVDWVDVDGDGDLDVAAFGAYDSALWLNNAGTFDDTLYMPFGTAIIPGTAWLDLDGDGLLDFAGAGYEAPAGIARVTVGGADKLTLTPVWSDTATDATTRHKQIRFGDVDRDGNLDVLVTGESLVRVWRNTSTTSFTTGATPYFDHPSFDIPGAVLADLDEDGDLDVVVLADGANLAILRNNHAQGTDSFSDSPTWQSADNYGFGRIAVGDVDGDHHLDLVVGVEPSAPANASAVYLNRAGALGQLGTAADKPNAIDPEVKPVEDLALTGWWQ